MYIHADIYIIQMMRIWQLFLLSYRYCLCFHGYYITSTHTLTNCMYIFIFIFFLRFTILPQHSLCQLLSYITDHR